MMEETYNCDQREETPERLFFKTEPKEEDTNGPASYGNSSCYSTFNDSYESKGLESDVESVINEASGHNDNFSDINSVYIKQEKENVDSYGNIEKESSYNEIINNELREVDPIEELISKEKQMLKEQEKREKISQENLDFNESQDSLESSSNKISIANEERIKDEYYFDINILNKQKDESLSDNCYETSVGILPCDLLKVEFNNEPDRDTYFNPENEYNPNMLLSKRKLMTDDKLREVRERDRLRQLKKRKSMNEEELVAMREKQKLLAREKRKNLAGEKLLEVREKQRIRAVMKRRCMDDEKLKEVRERDRIRTQEKRKTMNMEKLLEFREKQRINAQEKRKNYSEDKLKEVRERERIRAKERRQGLSKDRLDEIRERERIRAQDRRRTKNIENMFLQSLENPFDHILDTHSHFIDTEHSNSNFESSMVKPSEMNNLSSLFKNSSDIHSTNVVSNVSNAAFVSSEFVDILGRISEVEKINEESNSELESNIENSNTANESNNSVLTQSNSEYESIIEKTNTTVKNLIDMAQSNKDNEMFIQSRMSNEPSTYEDILDGSCQFDPSIESNRMIKREIND